MDINIYMYLFTKSWYINGGPLPVVTQHLSCYFTLFLLGTHTQIQKTNRIKLGIGPRMCQMNADTMKNNQDMPLWLLMQPWLLLKLTDAKANCQISSVCANADNPARCLAAGLAPTPVAHLYVDCLLNNNKNWFSELSHESIFQKYNKYLF